LNRISTNQGRRDNFGSVNSMTTSINRQPNSEKKEKGVPPLLQTNSQSTQERNSGEEGGKEEKEARVGGCLKRRVMDHNEREGSIALRGKRPRNQESALKKEMPPSVLQNEKLGKIWRDNKTTK